MTDDVAPVAEDGAEQGLGRAPAPPTADRSSLGRIAAVAALCWAAAAAGHLIALPAALTLPFAPTAGIALAAFLIHGPRIWPGVWLGGFAALLTLDSAVGGPWAAAVLASGATLQAWLGWLLTRGLFASSTPLARQAQVWRFLLMGGPLACLVSASIATIALFALGGREPAALAVAWLDRWASDTLGVVLIAPIALALWPGGRSPWPHGIARITLPLAIAAALLSASQFEHDASERGRLASELQRRVDQTYQIGIQPLAEALAKVASIERFLSASEEVTRAEFALFTTPLLAGPALQAVEWLPRIAAADRPTFETEHGVAVRTPTAATTADADRAGDAFPILFAASPTDRAAPIGLDRAAVPGERALMARARDGGYAAGPIDAPRSGAAEVVVYAPVRQGDPAVLTGFVRTSFSLVGLLAPLTETARDNALLLRVTDATPGEPGVALAGIPSETGAMERRQAIAFADRHWRLELGPDPKRWPPGAGHPIHSHLYFSVILGVLAAFATLAAASRRTATEAAVAARTGALRDELEARQAAEAALRESEAYSRSIVDSVQDCLKVLSLDGRLLDMAPRGRELMCVADFAQLRGADWLGFWEGEDRKAARQAIAEATAGRLGQFSGFAPTMDGTPKWWDVTITPVRDPDGRPERLLCLSRDVTAQQRANAEVRQLNADLERRVAARTAELYRQREESRLLLENLAEGVLVCDAEARPTLFNRAAREWLGHGPQTRPPEEWATYYGLYEPDGVTPLAAERLPLVSALRGARLAGVELCIRAEGQPPRFVLASDEAIEDASGQRVGAIATLYDVTEIRRSARRLATLFESSPDAILTVDQQGLITQVNRQTERLFGWSRAGLVGQPVEMLVPQDRRHHHEAQRRHYTERPQTRPMTASIQSTLRGQRRDGSTFAVNVSLGPIESTEGTLIVATIRDVTERERTLRDLQRVGEDLRAANEAIEHERERLAQRVAERTAELTAAKAEAEQASRAKSAFLATMSHEIRTPMNGVVGLLEVLAHSDLSEHQRDLVSTIEDSAQLLLGIIDDILDFSKIEAGRLEVARLTVSVRDLLEGLCGSLLPLASTRDVDLTLFVAPEIPARVIADEVRLRQILYNLIGNAIKFSGGRPDVRGRVAIRATLADAPSAPLVFSVSDNGIGMAPATMNDLFQPFTQAEVTTTRRFGGTGLGLAISKRLVDMMGGALTVESALGEGATFTVRLPCEASVDQPAELLPDLAGLDCVLVRRAGGLDVADLGRYLAAAGARPRIVADDEAAARLAAGLAEPVVVIQMLDHEHRLQRRPGAAFVGQDRLRHLLIGWGQRRRARVHAPNVVTLDGDALRRLAFLRAVAIAAGRASPEPVPESGPERPLIEAAAAPSVAEARAQDRLILVAEDDAVNQQVIRQQLALLGYAAEIADDGAEALARWRTGAYALLLTDLHMPELDGYELTQTIRREETDRRRPIVALTANALRGEPYRARATGMDDYLTKPVQLPRLREVLQRWLPAAGASPRQDEAAPGIPPHSATATGRWLDLSVLAGLVGDDPEIIQELLRECLTGTRHGFEALHAAVTTADPAAIGATAHRLKSSLRAAGARSLGDLCAALERSAKTKTPDWEGITRLMAEADATWHEVERAISAELAGTGGQDAEDER
ncbi:PAS domain S-box protein [Thiococcus pfennigii]|uniref:PAS domain S-box protein n=1 Tax=Thiococcus pfennigii TaxID=1057 RepID=UPI001902E067|nr:PAS domain S-box protein [Thiococcus pfennigii]MBK1731758.1 hypothetical protein [Thiococcus pfennigii]